MLTILRIQNLALVERLEWSPSAGFIAVTGETGAGKSVILGALKLLLGERADRGIIRTGAEQCMVEAILQVRDREKTNRLLMDSGVDPCEEDALIIRRTLSASGQNRQFVNGSPTTLAVLRELGNRWLDLHGPHDHQSLFSQEAQMRVLDAYGHAQEQYRKFREQLKIWQRVKEEYDLLEQEEEASGQEVELLRFQVEEIRGAGFEREDEEEQMEAEYVKASHGRHLMELAQKVEQNLEGAEDAVLFRLGETQRLLQEMEKLDPGLEDTVQAHRGIVVELEEVARFLRGYVEEVDLDEQTLKTLEEQMNRLQSLKRKYGPTLGDVLRFAEQAETRLQKIEGRGDALAQLEITVQQERKKLLEEGKKLRELRLGAAPALSQEVKKHLSDLGFRQAEFHVELLELDDLWAGGMERVEFVFGPNPGEPNLPLRQIASSGEISRVMLALKTALAEQDSVPVLVFDEIDANVGGEIAHAVGRKMRELGRNHQVFCITHLPQVASQAGSHFVVAKLVEGDRTHSLMEECAGDARVEEIARMLGGVTPSALDHARALLKEGGNKIEKVSV